MNNRIFIIAHAPLATALRQCVAHVFPDSIDEITALDVQPDMPPEMTLDAARKAMAAFPPAPTLVLTDIFGATPCNIAQKLADEGKTKLVTGVNLPMLLRAVTYRGETLATLVDRVVTGGTQGIMQVAASAPQLQTRLKNDQDHGDHQQ